MANNYINNKDISTLYIDITATALLFTGCCLLQFLNMGYVDWYYILSVFIALGCGVMHTMILNRNYANNKLENFGKSILLTGLVMIINLLLTGIVTLFAALNFSFLTFQLAFIIPFFINQALNYFLNIPDAEYKLWYYPQHSPLSLIENLVDTETEKVKFVLSKEFHDAKQTSFTLDNTPIDTPLGEVFFNLIKKSNNSKSISQIRYNNENKEPFGWLFYTKKGWLKNKNVIDPELSFRSNRIHSNEIIFATREKNPESSSPDFTHLERLSEN